MQGISCMSFPALETRKTLTLAWNAVGAIRREVDGSLPAQRGDTVVIAEDARMS